jgi:hypothetical protein
MEIAKFICLLFIIIFSIVNSLNVHFSRSTSNLKSISNDKKKKLHYRKLKLLKFNLNF